MSCFNDSNSFCLNGGQCIADYCVCNNTCFIGTRCEIHNNINNLPFPSAILEDLPSTRIIYIVILTILVVIGLINNILALNTFLREPVRLRSCGIYLIGFCLCSLVLMIFFQTNILIIIGYDSQSYRLWSCQIIPYISLTLGFTGIWLSVGIAIENVLIECFNFDIHRSRLRTSLTSFGFFLFAAISNLYVIFTRFYTKDLLGREICIFCFDSNSKWDIVKTIFSYIHIIMPCIIHLICSICILITIVRRKILIDETNKYYYRVWFRQMYNHRDFFIPPICIIICLFPNTIYVQLLKMCVPYSDLNKLRAHISFVILLHIPYIFTYMVYVYPSKLYLGEFYQTFIYKKLCCYCYRKRILLERRRRASSVATIQGLIENIHRNGTDVDNQSLP